MKASLFLTAIAVILYSAPFDGEAMAGNESSPLPLSAVYCQSAEPASLTVCSTLTHTHRVLSRGSLYRIISDGHSRLAVLQENGAVVTYDRGKKTRTFYAKSSELISWMAAGLLYSRSGKLLLFDPITGRNRAAGIDGDNECTVASNRYTYLVQASVGSTQVLRLAPNAKQKLICALPKSMSPAAYLINEGLLIVKMRDLSKNATINMFLINLSSGSFHEIPISKPVSALCAGSANQLILGELDTTHNEDGMARTTDIVSIDIATFTTQKLCRLAGQVSPVGAICGSKDIVATQHVNAHGPGKLISFSPDTGKTTVLQRNVYNAFPAY